MTTAVVTTVARSKPEHINDLRRTWRRSTEHKVAQVKRFVFALAGVLAAQIIPEVLAGKDPLNHFTDAHTAWYYLLPFALIAWRQVHPSMTASQADSAPGVTIVPEQVTPDAPAPSIDDAPAVDTAPEDDSGLANIDVPLTTALPAKAVLVKSPPKKTAAKKAPAKKTTPPKA